jgi:hypothetical protein
MRWIRERHSGKHIGLPKIGTGLAGGGLGEDIWDHRGRIGGRGCDGGWVRSMNPSPDFE